MVTIPKDFKEFLGSLNDHGVEYAVVGGYAVAFHGAPRFTGDLDVLVKRSAGNARMIVQALVEFGFPDTDFAVDDFLRPEMVVQFGRPPLRVDLLTSIDGTKWSEIERHLLRPSIDGIEICMIGRDELVANKRASGRAKDLADLESLGEL